MKYVKIKTEQFLIDVSEVSQRMGNLVYLLRSPFCTPLNPDSPAEISQSRLQSSNPPNSIVKCVEGS